jgi:periodic tryptophan protein 2
MSSRVHATERFKNLICYVLGGHNEAIVGCFFEKNSLNVSLNKKENLIFNIVFLKAYTVSRNGRLNVWECDTPLNGLVEKKIEEEKEIEVIKEDVLEDKKSKNKNGDEMAIDDDDSDLPDDDIRNIGITYKKKAK